MIGSKITGTSQVGTERAPSRRSARSAARRPSEAGSSSRESLRATLNQKHLARIGTLTFAQPAVIDVHFVDAGTHDVGLEIGADGGLVLLIHRPIAPLRLSFAPGAPGARGPHVPQAAFAFLAGDDPERLEVEGDVVAEFCNFALANSAVARKSSHA